MGLRITKFTYLLGSRRRGRGRGGGRGRGRGGGGGRGRGGGDGLHDGANLQFLHSAALENFHRFRFRQIFQLTDA